MADPIPLRPEAVSTTEARLMFNRNVAAWVKLLEDNGLRSGSFKIQSRGLHEVETTFEVGVHVDAFDALGYEVVSHSVLFAKTPSGDVTVTSLLVRKRAPSVPDPGKRVLALADDRIVEFEVGTGLESRLEEAKL